MTCSPGALDMPHMGAQAKVGRQGEGANSARAPHLWAQGSTWD